MLQLSELDSSFLFLETDRTPLHVGGVFIFKKNNNRTKFSFNRFRDIINSKLGNEPFFRERLIESPLNLDMPVWTDDPQFDLDNHLHYINLNKRTEATKLMELASQIYGTPLDRSRPLWHVTYVDGLDNQDNLTKQHFALIIRVHLTAIDSITGEDVLSQLLHVSPEVSEIGELEPWEPEPLPNSGNWLGAAYNSALTLPNKLAHLAKETASAAFYSILHDRLQSLNLPSSLMSVAATPINCQISNKRVIDNIEIPMSDIRTIRKNMRDVTTNDVVMGICAEALTNYLKDNDSEPGAPLIALAPISVRSTSLDIKSGNQLAATLFSLASTEKDPVKRIRLIHENATSSNSYDAAIKANRLTELVPSCIAALSARVYSEFLLAQKHKPMFNLPITNIPGPQFPLYFEDNELTNYICAMPLFDGIGLAMMVISYNGYYSITTTYCPDSLKQDKPFSAYLQDALQKILSCKDLDESGSTSDNSAKTKQQSSSGFIEDAVGLVNNLFSFGGKESEKTDG